MATGGAEEPRYRYTVSEIKSALDSEALAGFLTILPTILIFLVIAIVPALYALWAGFHEISALNPVWEWIGLGNYEIILQSPEFYNAISNGLIYTLGSVVIQLFLGVGVAILLNKVESRLVTSASLALYVIPTVVIVVLFQWMLDERYGILMQSAASFGIVDSTFSVWAFGDLAMAAVILIGSYKFSIFITLMVLARLESIPNTYYEAATVGGATTLQKFVYITWPQIRGVVALVVLLRGIFMFNKFDVIWMLTSGGPGDSTTTLPIWAFTTTFDNYAYGVGSAIAIVMFLLLAVGGIIYLGVFNPEEDVEGGEAA